MIKQKSFRSKKYLAFVRTLPCSICGTDQDVVAHHLIGVGGMGGMGTKAPDNFTLPLCAEDHSKIHQEPELWQDQWEWIAITQSEWIHVQFNS
tara:strand:+ start:369 stop:647 length:279 start_codon:yes stop_codon:yes gene_type:complete